MNDINFYWELGIKIVVIIVIVFFLYTENNWITITEETVASEKIPKSFNGYKILQISDLHGKSFEEKLVEKIKDVGPDLIVITGDAIDSRRYSDRNCLDLIEQIVSLAPIYYVTGNHEARLEKFSIFESKLIRAGVNVLRDESDFITIDGSQIKIIGMDDPAFSGNAYFEETLSELSTENKDQFSVVLSHRPEIMTVYTEQNIDLVFSGHAHGGQVRLPFIGGIAAPNQGFFPKYTSGLYQINQTVMVVSRGLGNSIFPQRLFNRPELVVITLKNERLLK